MATNIASFIPNVVAARFIRTLEDTYVWGMLANRNYEGDLSAGGNTVKIPTSTTTLSVGDYVVGDDIADPMEVSGSTQDLVLDKQKYFNFLVDDIEEFQSTPNVMDETMKQAAIKIADQVDDDMQAIFNGGHAAARSERVTAALTDANWGQQFVQAVINTNRDMTKAKVPIEERWLVLHPDVLAALEVYLVAKAAAGNVFTPATADETLRNGFSGHLLGFRTFVTNKCPSVAVSSVNYWRCFAGQGTNAVTMAEQIASVEPYRPEKRFADAVKGLYVYGGKLIESAGLFDIEARQA